MGEITVPGFVVVIFCLGLLALAAATVWLEVSAGRMARRVAVQPPVLDVDALYRTDISSEWGDRRG